MLWRFLVNKNDDVRIGQLPASTAPGEELISRENFVQQPPKSKSLDGDKDPNVYHTN
jgi:hypothetical protein